MTQAGKNEPGRTIAADGVKDLLNEFGELISGEFENIMPLGNDQGSGGGNPISAFFGKASKGKGAPKSLSDVFDLAKDLTDKQEETKNVFTKLFEKAKEQLENDAPAATSEVKGKIEEAMGELRKVIPQMPEIPNINLQDMLGEAISGNLGGLDMSGKISDIQSKFGDALIGKGMNLDSMVSNLTDMANPAVLSQLGEMDTALKSMKSKIKNLGDPAGAEIASRNPIAGFVEYGEALDEEDEELFGGPMTEPIFDADVLRGALGDNEPDIPAINKSALKGLKNKLTAQTNQLQNLKNKLGGIVGQGASDLPSMIKKMVPNLQMDELGNVMEKAIKPLHAAMESVPEIAASLELEGALVAQSQKLKDNTSITGDIQHKFDELMKSIKILPSMDS